VYQSIFNLFNRMRNCFYDVLHKTRWWSFENFHCKTDLVCTAMQQNTLCIIYTCTSAIQKAILDLLNIHREVVHILLIDSIWWYVSHRVLDIWPNGHISAEYSILNFLYIFIDSIWCYISQTVVHIWPTEHISGQREFDIELLIYTFWCLLISREPCSPCNEHISGPRVLDLELSIHTLWLLILLALQNSILDLLTFFSVQTVLSH